MRAPRPPGTESLCTSSSSTHLPYTDFNRRDSVVFPSAVHSFWFKREVRTLECLDRTQLYQANTNEAHRFRSIKRSEPTVGQNASRLAPQIRHERP